MYHCAWPEVAWLLNVTSSNVTWPSSNCDGRVKCALYPPYWGLFIRSDVIKRHVTPNASPWKGGMGACATGSRGFLPIRESLDRIWRYETSCDPVELSLDNMEARMRNRKCSWYVILFVLKVLLPYHFVRTSPFTGYLLLSRHFIFKRSAFNNYISYKSLLFSDMFEVVS